MTEIGKSANKQLLY